MRKRGLVTAFAVAFALGCSSSTPTNGGAAPMDANPCASGHGHQDPGGRPLVCIDFAIFDTMAYEPDPNPVEAKKTAHMDYWFYNYHEADKPDLDLQFTADTPVIHIRCNGPHCSVEVRPNADPMQRKYSIIDRTSGRHKDPDIIIEP